MKNGLKCVLFGIIFIIIAGIITFLLLPKNSVFKYGVFKAARHEILMEPKNTIDTVIVGDSLIYSSISPMEIWNEYGYTTFDVAAPAQLISDSYENIKVILENQKPKVIFFESNVLFRDPKKKPWYSFWQKLYKTYFPLMKYHNNWKKYLFTSFNDKAEFIKYNVYKGYSYDNHKKPGKKFKYMVYSKKVKDIPEENKVYFEKIYDLCKKNNIELILISTPNMNSWNYEKYAGAKRLAKQYDLKYIDLNYNNPLQINWKDETRDYGSHLNYKGALKVSHFIGDYLKTNKLVKDHRHDKSYQLWNEGYKYYRDSLK